MTFRELQLNDSLLSTLQKNGFEKPTEIQSRAIPVFLANNNLFGRSSTGTGKTASFVLPILHNIVTNISKPQALILAPTRELALQIVDQIKLFGGGMKNLRVAPIIGGAEMRRQVQRLKESQIVVGTPGRITDHLNRGSLSLKNLKTIILDEGDEMLKMGFKNEINQVFDEIPNNIQVGLFSATINNNIMQIAKSYMKKYELIEINNEIEVNRNITNTYIFTKGVSKEELILEVFKKHDPYKVIIFTNTKSNTDRIARNLKSINIKAAVINGDKKQAQRSRAIQQFKNNEYQALVATDVVARGIHIDDIDYVINFDISREDENFVHRIGRTGRNNKTGNSISFIQNKNTLSQLQQIQKKYKIAIDEISFKEYNLIQSKDNSTNNFTPNSRGQASRSSSSRGQSNRGGRNGGSSNNRGTQKSFASTSEGEHNFKRRDDRSKRRRPARSNSW